MHSINTWVRPELDLHDLLKQRVEAGAPVYLSGLVPAAPEALVRAIACESGDTASIGQMGIAPRRMG
jgi:hypothetical protein